MNRRVLYRGAGAAAAVILLAGTAASARPVRYACDDRRDDRGALHRAGDDRREHGRRSDSRRDYERCDFPAGLFHGGGDGRCDDGKPDRRGHGDDHRRGRGDKDDDKDRGRGDRKHDHHRSRLARDLCGDHDRDRRDRHAFDFGCMPALVIVFGDGFGSGELPQGIRAGLVGLVHHGRGHAHGILIILGGFCLNGPDGNGGPHVPVCPDDSDHNGPPTGGPGGGDNGPPRPTNPGQPIPLPSTALLAGVGLAGIAVRRRRAGMR